MSKLRHNRKLQQVTPAGKVLERHKTIKRSDIEAQQAHEKINIEPYVIAKFADKKITSKRPKPIPGIGPGVGAPCQILIILNGKELSTKFGN